MLKTCKSVFNVSKYSYASNYTLDENSKTTLPGTTSAYKLGDTDNVIIYNKIISIMQFEKNMHALLK